MLSHEKNNKVVSSGLLELGIQVLQRSEEDKARSVVAQNLTLCLENEQRLISRKRNQIFARFLCIPIYIMQIYAD